MLVASTGTDGDARKAAEAQLAKLLKAPAVGGSLFTVLRASSHVPVRQLGGVLLRKKVIAYWNRLSSAHKGELQRALIAQLASEPERLVRKSIVSVIAALAKACLPGGGWPELLALLQDCPRSPNGQVRELGLVLLRELVEGLGPRLVDQAAALRPVFAAGLADADEAVRVAALRALIPFVSQLEDEKPSAAKSYGEMLPTALGVTQQAMAGGQDAAAQAALEGLTELVELDARSLRPYSEQLALFLCGVLAATTVEDTTRASAGGVLVQLLLSRPKTIAKKGLLASAILPAAISCLLEFDAEADQEAETEAREAGVETALGEEDPGSSQAWNVAAHVIDVAAQALPSRTTFPALGGAVQTLLASDDWRRRRAGVAILAAASEGCADAYQDSLDMVLGAVVARVGDPAPPVRVAACWALAQFADHLQPRIGHAHPTVLPPLLAALGDSHPMVVDRACMAVEMYAEGLAPAVLGTYLPAFMGQLGAVLSAPSQPVWLQETVVTALSSVAIGGGRLLTPYLPQLAPALLTMAALTDARFLRLRATATECLGHVAVAVGREAFSPYLTQAMSTVAAGFDLDVSEVSTNAFAFFACAAEVLGPALEPVLPGLWSRLREALTSSDDIAVTFRDSDSDAGAGGDLAGRLLGEDGDGGDEAGAGARGGDDGGSDDSDWNEGDDDGGRKMNLRVRTSYLDVKTAAINCVNQLASHCGGAFGPFISDSVSILDGLTSYFHDDVRGYALQALRAVTLSAVELAAPSSPAAASGTAAPAALAPATSALLNDTMTKLIDALQCDQSKQVVGAAANAIQRIAKALGVTGVGGHAKAIVGALLNVIRERSPCQMAPHEREGDEEGDSDDEEGDSDDEEGEEGEGEDGEEGGSDDESEEGGAAAAGANGDDDEEGDPDNSVTDMATDALAEVARALGPEGFAPYLPKTVRALLRFARPSRPTLLRVTALGACSELLQYLGTPAMTPYVPSIASAVCSALGDVSAEVRRNAAFGANMLISRAPADTRPHLPRLLPGLQAILTGGRGRGDAEELVFDNGLAALASVLITLPDAVPVAVVVPAIVAALPLRGDHDEAGTVLGALLQLAAQRQPQAVGALPAIMAHVAAALAPSSPVSHKLRTERVAPEVRRFAYAATESDRAAIGAAAAAMAPAEREALQAALEGRYA